VAVLPAAARADSGYGALYLSTLPAGASVWIDATYVGRTPVLVDPLTRGHHAVTMTKIGWSVEEVDVDVQGGSTAMATFRLHGAPHHGIVPRGGVAFRGLEPGTSVAIDGDAVAHAAGMLPLASGTHVAVLRTPSGAVSRTFTVYPDMTTEVPATDVRAAETRSAIVAPAEEFLPDEAYTLTGRRVVVRYGGHEVVAQLGTLEMRFDGTSVSYDAPPSRINGRLYLPLALLTRLTATKAK
jgi:hypothetical protein